MQDVAPKIQSQKPNVNRGQAFEHFTAGARTGMKT